MDVQARRVALGLILLLALALRLKGIHNPLLDHPAWRQGDTASIARNFALLQYNIFYPQTNYNGPPPNYVELELQIVPFIAATLYKLFGIHEIFGRLITVAFSVGTVAVLYGFGRWLFASALAGLLAALLYAVMPGSVYYGRTFMPDATMVFFLTAALYVAAWLFVEQELWRRRAVAGATALFALAYLAKQVALVALVPLTALAVERVRQARTMQWGAVAAIALVPLGILYAYERFVGAHAEWHWASGITTLHVAPALSASLKSGTALHAKLLHFKGVLGMLAATMLGAPLTALATLGFIFANRGARSATLLWSWLLGALLYVYVVVTVERVDYYMFLLLPLAALAGAGFLVRLWEAVAGSALSRSVKYGALAVGLGALAFVVAESRSTAAPYYRFSVAVYRNAVALNATLPPRALIVMGHYDPAVLYYIGRYGWEEDPYLWTPFDEQSAIAKGARYFIAIEDNRFNRNVELCAWMQRFPLLDSPASWPIYETDPSKVKPGAEVQWRAFRNAEKAGNARAWLDAHGLCPLTQKHGKTVGVWFAEPALK